MPLPRWKGRRGNYFVSGPLPCVDHVCSRVSIRQIDVPAFIGLAGVHPCNYRTCRGSFDPDESTVADTIGSLVGAKIPQIDRHLIQQRCFAHGAVDSIWSRRPFARLSVDKAVNRAIGFVEWKTQ